MCREKKYFMLLKKKSFLVTLLCWTEFFIWISNQCKNLKSSKKEFWLLYQYYYFNSFITNFYFFLLLLLFDAGLIKDRTWYRYANLSLRSKPTSVHPGLVKDCTSFHLCLCAANEPVFIQPHPETHLFSGTNSTICSTMVEVFCRVLQVDWRIVRYRFALQYYK